MSQIVYRVIEETIQNKKHRVFEYYSLDIQEVMDFVDKRQFEMQSKNMIRQIKDSDYTPDCVIYISFLSRHTDTVYQCRVLQYMLDNGFIRHSARDTFGRF